MWLAGRDYGDLARLLSPSIDLTYADEDDSSPLGLDVRVLSLLTDSIALNSTAELRPSDGELPVVLSAMKLPRSSSVISYLAHCEQSCT